MKKNKLFTISNKMVRKSIYILFLIIISQQSWGQKTYQKNYHSNGELKDEGWGINDEKIDYWKFYYKNGAVKKEGHYKNNLPTNYWYFYSEDGKKEKEGHFINGKQNKWWLYYDKVGNVNHKCQLKDNIKNGYCLLYRKKQLIKAVKFKDGKKINEWSDFSSFKKENDLNDLK